MYIYIYREREREMLFCDLFAHGGKCPHDDHVSCTCVVYLCHVRIIR